MMLRWSTAAAACLLLGGVRGAVVAASEESGQARRGEAERRSLKMTKDESLEKMIFDFTDAAIFGEEQAASWWESSDTVRWEQLQQFGKVFTTVYYKIKLIRSAGMSKAVFSLQRSVRFQRALLFAIINPQPNGAGFAGMKTNITFTDEQLKVNFQYVLLQELSLGFF